MEENKTNINSLDPEKRKALLDKMKDTYELMEYQALIAEARTRIKKANLEEIVYALKQHELEQKPKTDGSSEKS